VLQYFQLFSQLSWTRMPTTVAENLASATLFHTIPVFNSY